MSDSLRVDAEESRMAAHRLDMHAAELAASDDAAAHADMASTVPGAGATSSAAR